MRFLDLTKQLFWLIATVIIAASLLITFYLHSQTKDIIENRAYERAKLIQNYFISMRHVYLRQFLDSGIDLNDSTVGFLPAHASARISTEFSKRNKDGTTIRNVTDRFRNPVNKADTFEEDAIRYFEKNPTSKERMESIQEEGRSYFFYTVPLKISPYCMQCHGKKEDVIPYISRRYDTAYDYALGDIRGVTSIKMPYTVMADETLTIFWKNAYFAWTTILALLGIIYTVIRQLTLRDVAYKEELEIAVVERTRELKQANSNQQHLNTVLRTIADINQILVTANSLDELIDMTASTLAENETFSCVKISLVKDGVLQVKSFYGLGEASKILPSDQMVFEQSDSVIITDLLRIEPDECRENAKKYHLTAIYIAALHKDTQTKETIGVLRISTAKEHGFTPEEKAMMDELTGDLSFAINSFHQKEDILRLSFYDALTGLPNRRMLIEHLKQAINASSRTGQYSALLFIDLDNFKSINDLKGHATGDELLRQMGQRLSSLLRQSDTIARFGGDEFVILIENIDAQQHMAATDIQVTVQKILEAAVRAFIIDEQPFYVSASIGISLFSGEGESIDQLFAQADSAMYAAKDNGRNTARFYDVLLQKTMAEEARMINDLRVALANHQIHTVYQEQVDAKGMTIGVEALMRWEHPQHGFISPVEFIPLAESTGIIITLGEWILEEAIEQIKIWSQDPIKQHWRVSVNVSQRQFEEATYVSGLRELFYRTSVDPSKIRLELTEGLLIQDTKSAMEKINILKAIGLSLSIDDFGTGYSSLSYLKEIKIDEIKIDRSFVRGLPESPTDAKIVQTIISMAKAFGLEIIAEGVEREEQFKLLKEMGCDNFQGYLFSKPKKAEYYI